MEVIRNMEFNPEKVYMQKNTDVVEGALSLYNPFDVLKQEENKDDIGEETNKKQHIESTKGWVESF